MCKYLSPLCFGFCVGRCCEALHIGRLAPSTKRSLSISGFEPKISRQIRYPLGYHLKDLKPPANAALYLISRLTEWGMLWRIGECKKGNWKEKDYSRTINKRLSAVELISFSKNNAFLFSVITLKVQYRNNVTNFLTNEHAWKKSFSLLIIPVRNHCSGFKAALARHAISLSKSILNTKSMFSSTFENKLIINENVHFERR